MMRRVLNLWGGARLGWVLPGLLVVIMFVILSSGEASYQANLVSVEGSLTEDQRQDVYQHLVNLADQKQNILQIKAMLEQVDWVHRVEVSKSWPDSLTVLVIEETPIAYWNESNDICRLSKTEASWHIWIVSDWLMRGIRMAWR